MENKMKWSLAAKYGLILSLVTIVVSLIGMFELPGWLGTIISLAKFVAIIYLLKYFMIQYTKMSEVSVSYGESFKFGFKVCLLSSVICTTYSYIDYTLIRPETIEILIETFLTTQESMGAAGGMIFDYQTLSTIMPKVIIFSIFFDCIIFGLIFPAILASSTKSSLFSEEETNTEE